MAIRMIRTGDDPILRQKAKPVKEITPVIEKLLDDMAATMYHAEGIGLAAPQVGVPKRVIVMDCQTEEQSGLIELINPEVIEQSGQQTGSEGCLSLPGLAGDVTRAKRITVRGMNRQGEMVEIRAENLLARCVLHEVDHLDGILFIDYLKPSEIRRVAEKESR